MIYKKQFVLEEIIIRNNFISQKNKIKNYKILVMFSRKRGLRTYKIEYKNIYSK